MPGDPIDGDTWSTFASAFFVQWCTRCHSTTTSDRMGAPPSYNWDDPASVRTYLPMIRYAAGVGNYMPLTPPLPSCAERRRLVRWIDAGAP